ncbi:MAG: serine/threonine protein kinase [Myxococcaceae bacterium]|nr:serine/threonine protein kinase [Myxococcaceae bacterium]
MSTSICKRCGAETPEWKGTCAKCGGTEAVKVAPAEDFTGRTVKGRFQLTRKIGQGGMGTVYEAEDLKLGMRAAVKFLNPELSRNVELARRFLSEARTYARVSHPGAVTLHDFGQDDDGTLYIAMEFVEGETLRDLLTRRKRLPLAEAADVVLQVANVLGDAHEKGVVHRDLKPENVMVRGGLHGFHVKLLDFGVARRTYEGATQLTQVGSVAGTPRYMPPEQARGEEVDARADIYALGLVAFELITGVAANEVPDLRGIQTQKASPVRALGAVDPALHHPKLDAVLDRATQAQRERRYGTMAELAAAFSAAARVKEPNEAPTEKVVPVPRPAPIPLATPYYPAPPAAPPPAQRRPWLLFAALGLIALLGSGAGYLFSRRPDLVVVQQPPPSACPALTLYSAELRELGTTELERRVLGLRIYRPSDARKHLQQLKATVESYAPEQRDCMYRSMLLGSITSEQTVLKTTPALWGHTREVGRLKSLFLELPLKHAWSPEQRAQILRRIETLFIANLEAKDEADRDFWRRQYYGIELLCEVTDDALTELHTERPDSCLNLMPE